MILKTFDTRLYLNIKICFVSQNANRLSTSSGTWRPSRTTRPSTWRRPSLSFQVKLKTYFKYKIALYNLNHLNWFKTVKFLICSTITLESLRNNWSFLKRHFCAFNLSFDKSQPWCIFIIISNKNALFASMTQRNFAFLF